MSRFDLRFLRSLARRAPPGQLHEALLADLNAAGALDWSRAVIDSSHVRALRGGPKPGRARSTVPGPAQAPRDH